MTDTVSLSQLAQGVRSETAFDVLAVARRLKSQGKDVVELQIGDSPFATPEDAKAAGIRSIENNVTHYCASLGLPAFREVIAANYRREFKIDVTAANVVIGSGAKIFEQFFCEAVLDPGDSVLVFTPHFPTYTPNIERRGARVVFSVLRQDHEFRPDLNDVEHFLKKVQRPKAIFLNSPHNPTGGVATAADMRGIAELIRGRNVAVLSDEPYCHMVWNGLHHSLLAEPGMLDQTVAAYTFSKSYSMSGWRLGYAVSHSRLIETIGKMINTSLSCVPPMIQMAGQAALENAATDRDQAMAKFRAKVELLVNELRRVDDVAVLMPAGTFYVFPNVSAICRRANIQSHGLAMYLLEGAADHFGVACLGGECFGSAGQGFLRFSCAEPDDRLQLAVAFLADAVKRTDRIKSYLAAHPNYLLGH